MNVATSIIAKPINPVNRKTSKVTNVRVIFTISEYGRFETCLANILPIFNDRKYESIAPSSIAINR